MIYVLGVWTLLFGALMKIEKFTFRKFLGVIASLIGIILISRVDLTKSDTDTSAADDGSQGNFPHKTSGEIALGDAMAAFSSLLYGLYTIVMKKQAGDESRVNMALFFGLVGLFNVVMMWPGFIILHLTGVEPFGLPDTKRVWTIILVGIFKPPPLFFLLSHMLNLLACLVQLALIFHFRYCLGIRHASHDPSSCDCWPELDYSIVIGGANCHPGPVRKCALLGWCRDCVSLFRGRQPREQDSRR